MWSDSSWVDSERTGAGVARKHQQERRTGRVYKGTNKEVFDATLYPIAEDLDIVIQKDQTGRRELQPRQGYISG